MPGETVMTLDESASLRVCDADSRPGPDPWNAGDQWWAEGDMQANEWDGFLSRKKLKRIKICLK